ncbi:MAG TPA: SMP-30/gluconolactonase/LRE family protein [Hyphomicrobiaceae bacterium]|nr:SMP-30/gluconolactonase/LRE family protein [Hyphomicrobiaceae bacterium]
MSLYPPPATVKAEVFARMPDNLRRPVRTAWADYNKGGQIADCFLEGPSFDRDGNLWVTDIPHGRIFKVSPAGAWTQVAEYDGWPNGLKLHKDGRAFITDYKRGIMVLDPASGRITPLIETVRSESFKGVNDLHFASNGDLYFTDQGQTGLHDPTGRVYRYTPDGKLTCLVNTVPSPNGLVLDLHEKVLFVAVTRANAVWRLPIMPDGAVSKVGVAVQLSGGLSGPDGLALDEEGGLIVAHAGMGCWRFDWLLRPTHFIEPGVGRFVTNVAFRGKRLYMTESESGSILTAEMPAAGKAMYAHA